MQYQGSVLHEVSTVLDRLVTFLVLLVLLIGFMFLAGNFQGFSDRTQFQLLRTLRFLSGAGSVISLALVVISLLRLAVARRWSHAPRLLLYLGFTLVLVVGSLGSSSLLVLLQPL